jgi:D-amino-acid dehydrogenase
MTSTDVVVLGAGIVGVSVAVHLQRRGRQTLLIDKQPPGRGASFGNAGLIQSEAMYPHMFPRALSEILRYAANRSSEATYRVAMLPSLLGPFAQYWHHSRPDRVLQIARKRSPLIRQSVADHLELAGAAGALDLLKKTGWIQVYQRPQVLESALTRAEDLHREFGVAFHPLDKRLLAMREPSLRQGLAGGLHWPMPLAVVDPYALTTAYAGLFSRLGGIVHLGDIRKVEQATRGWQVTTDRESVFARDVVIALGSWSTVLTKTLGYSPPLFAQRGYHMHYTLRNGAFLNSPILDAENGYMVAPMTRGIRLTTGAEFSHRDAPPTPRQLRRVEPLAHRLVPGLRSALDDAPWVGARPCLPDMLPIIGPAPRHAGVWYAFGHAHHGLTLGPTTGRLISALILGEEPFTDPAPYSAERFVNR